MILYGVFLGTICMLAGLFIGYAFWGADDGSPPLEDRRESIARLALAVIEDGKYDVTARWNKAHAHTLDSFEAVRREPKPSAKGYAFERCTVENCGGYGFNI